MNMKNSPEAQDHSTLPTKKRRKPSKNKTCVLHGLPPTLLFLVLTTPLHLTTAQDSGNGTCSFYEDSCRWDWQMDGYCDNEADSSTGCQGGDCWDCDPCRYWDYSCRDCEIGGDCYWCPGDSLCRSIQPETTFWTEQFPYRVSSCPNPSDWVQTCPDDQDNIFNDVLYSSMQWMWDMINVEVVWEAGIRGNGVKVRVNDDGIDPFHQEFIPRFDEANSCEDKYPIDNLSNVRGTAIASIVSGDANNKICSGGIAPNSKISSCNINLLSEAAYVFSKQLPNKVDISINPWNAQPCSFLAKDRQGQDTDTNKLSCPFNENHPQSPCRDCPLTDAGTLPNTPACQQAVSIYCKYFWEQPCLDYLDKFVTCQYNALDPITQEVINLNMVNGRDKKGVIFVFPAGDTDRLGTDGNMDAFVQSRFTIAVGAVDKEGFYTGYTAPGSPVLISAPGGDSKYLTNNLVARPGGGCRDAGFGTAYAVPVVAGVVALMLEANPALGWRDVQAILIQTARMVDPDRPGEWTTNGAGYKHSYHYGFGIVDAGKAVEAAKNWTNFRLEDQITAESDPGPPQIIWDDSGNFTNSTVEVEFLNALYRVESITVYVDLRHASRGDLQILLTSPSGTESLLARSKRPENTLEFNETAAELWKFTSVRHFWEYPGGTWQLSIKDESPGVLEACVDIEWMYNYSLGTMTCQDFDVATSCTNETEIDPVILEQEHEGRTPFESCCKCGGGQNRTMMTNVLKSWQLVIYGHISGDANSTELLEVTKSTCNVAEDTCPELQQFDHNCDDNLLNKDCMKGDCFDCDPCQTFNYDCNACITAKCFYCPGDGICNSIALNESFWKLHPGKTTSCPTPTDWMQTCDRRPENIFEDPLYEGMLWSYEMINVEESWKLGATGYNIHVRINDDGVDATHPEFAGKFDVEHSCSEYLPRDQDRDTHGTAVASIVAGNTNNQCSLGIAPDATISACVGPDTLDDAANMLIENLDTVHISVNSWSPNVCNLNAQGTSRRLQECIFSSEHEESPCGVCGDFSEPNEVCEAAVTRYCSLYYEDDATACSEHLDLWVNCQYHLLPLNAQQSFVKAATEGRFGRGVIFVFSAGNTNERGANTNSNGFINSRFPIAVGAVGKDGTHASYSTTGAGLFVSAPGGNFDSVSANLVAKPGGGCHDIGVGTSFSAPVVAGVIALMLQVKPELTWRDVQGIIAVEADKIDPDHPSWVTNAAGYAHSDLYGFGMIRAHESLNRASIWKSFKKEEQIVVENSEEVNIEDPTEGSIAATASSSVTILERLAVNFVTESVIVYLDLEHPSRGDLLIVLKSPGGTEAILHPGDRPENTQLAGGDDEFSQWKLLSLKTWGEFPIGEWKLTIQDKRHGNYESCVDLPWQYTYTRQGDGTNATLTCHDFNEVTDCNDSNEVDPKIVASSNILESCCACGGGKDAAAVKPILHKWKLVVYGHIIESEDDLIAVPQDSYEESTSDMSNNGEEDQGNEGNDNSLTDAPHGETSTGWDDEGNTGEFTGGGGTAWWAEGWTGGTEGDAFNYSARTDLYLGLSGGRALMTSWGALLGLLLALLLGWG